MRVLSCFDGMSCGMVALNRAGIPVSQYLASEIDKYAMQVSAKNWPDIQQIGDVRVVRQMAQAGLIGGSPCQNLSFAGKGNGFSVEVTDLEHYKKLVAEDFEFKGQSYLFWEYVWIKEILNPKWFLLENVRMKKKYLDVFNEIMGVEGVLINSALVSAQNRQRYYWCNWKVEQPEDRGIYLKDVVLSATIPVALHNLYGGFKEKSIRVFENKSPTLRTAAGGGHIPSFVKENLIYSEKALDYMDRKVKGGRSHWDFAHHSDVKNPKAAAVVANFFKGVPYNVFKDWDCIRKFHPVECERLMTLADNYTEGVSDTQRYKMIGNGWETATITHIFTQLILNDPEFTVKCLECMV